LPGCQTLHVFLPITDKKEPDTLALIFEINKQFPQIRIAVPVITANGSLIHVEPEMPLALHAGRWNIPVPEYTNEVNPIQLDCVIIPMLIFDEQGHRIGYGKGYYDAFLPQCRPDCIKLGISLFSPIDIIEDPMHADVVMDACITPDTIYVFNEVSKKQHEFINLS
jgi:5-formyltetrahydrofolate cyclo-ligase